MPGREFRFPDPRSVPGGLVTVGGDLSIPVLLDAYDHGNFPWHSLGQSPHWWSPDPRAVLDLAHLHVSHSLGRTLRRGGFRATWNRAFEQVVRQCGAKRAGGSWIHAPMIRAYCDLHRAGHAHSIEIWASEELAGGLYGVQRGAAFMAESMFHRVTGASKVALVLAVRHLFAAGVQLFEVQFLTPHLKSMGAFEIPRSDYLDRLDAARRQEISLIDMLLRYN